VGLNVAVKTNGGKPIQAMPYAWDEIAINTPLCDLAARINETVADISKQ